ncbi:hypothetical protein [Agreia pratensis]|uniref:Uncharacterized protein n=1 Tax=Agreia pratensis TaxID=150121 RepID=A0A1X7K1T7_9MICO|nr:hypothetical protein [Agreia pratensis]SMG34910.1 hypothetical protein SAMN06296010_1998 [Agreia pratensis]
MESGSSVSGIVTVGGLSIVLPETEARTLFLAAGARARRGGPIVISPDHTVYVNPSTQISLTIEGGFTEDYDPERDLAVMSRQRSATTT